ncbi:capon-like protein isoform 2-T2 [Cochliomyia hominivorax]
MPSTPYDLVQDDQDLRVPLHADQAFLNGITFQAKVSSPDMYFFNNRVNLQVLYYN